MTTTHTHDIWQHALAKWDGIANDFPYLAPAVALQKVMLRLLIDARDQLEDSNATLPGTTAAALTGKWHRGVPALRGETVPIPDTLTALLPALCDALAQGAGDSAAAHIGSALTAGEIDGGSLLRLSLARNRKALRTSSLHHGFAPDLVWVLGELGSAPLAHYCQTHLAEDRGLQTHLAEWDRGYCPCCGSWPAFIEHLEDRRLLRCSYCAATWTLASHRCVYCDNADDRFVSAAPDLTRPDRLVELCGACGGYTKVIGVTSPTPFPLLAIDDLATMDLDQGAMAHEYRRPDLFDLDPIDPLVSTGCE